MRTNFEAPSLLIADAAQRFAQRGSGIIVGISSVAGDRGRASNFVYGSAKAGFTAFLSGLRARHSRSGLRVVTVKPGFVATRMTAGIALPVALTAQPDEVAGAVMRAIDRRRDVVYVRPVWRLIMAVVTHIPEALFKKLRF
jgi:short-subunit dehydrogenase